MAKRGLRANGKLKPGCTYLRGGKIVCGSRAKSILARRRAKARKRGRKGRRGGTMMICYSVRK